MAKYPGLVRRGKRGTYWFRRRIPAHLIVELAIGPEINKSLGTKDYEEALERWATQDAAARKLFASEPEESRPSTTPADIVKAFELELRTLEIAYRLNSTSEFTDRTKEEEWFKVATHYRSRLQEKIATAKMKAVTMNGGEHLRWLMANFRDDVKADTLAELCSALIRADIRVHEAMLADDATLLPELVLSRCTPNIENGSAPLLSVFSADYINRRGNGLSAERADTIRATVRDLIAIAGDQPVSAYSAADASRFESAMLALPPNWKKH